MKLWLTVIFCRIERGQGLNNALKDASAIVDAIKAAVCGDTSLHAAITAYEAEMKPRGVTEVKLSLEQALKARDQNTIKDSPIFKQGWKPGEADAPVSVSIAEKAR